MDEGGPPGRPRCPALLKSRWTPGSTEERRTFTPSVHPTMTSDPDCQPGRRSHKKIDIFVPGRAALTGTGLHKIEVLETPQLTPAFQIRNHGVFVRRERARAPSGGTGFTEQHGPIRQSLAHTHTHSQFSRARWDGYFGLLA